MVDETNNGATNQSSAGQQSQAGTAGSAGQSAGAGNGQQNGQTSQSLTRPDWAPEAAWDKDKGFNLEAFGKHWTDTVAPVLTAHAAEQVRRNGLPQNADAYEVKNSAAFKVPEGSDFKLDSDNPMWSQAKAWAHKNGLSNEAFAEAIDIVAGRDLFTQQQVTNARKGEIDKLGTTGPARIDAIETFYKGLLGNDKEAKAVMSRVFTAADVQLHEKLISKFTTQGAAGFTQQHRVPNDNGKVSEEAYGKMNGAERWEYARQHDQSKMPAWRDPRG